MAHNAVEIPIRVSFAQSHTVPSNSGTTISNTHILPSKQIFGPTTSAAPLLMRKAKWSGGQTLERLHFGSGVVVAEIADRKVLLIWQEVTHTVNVEVM